MPLTPGTRLGPYEVSAPLGAGGMGEVSRARDTRLDRTVAIKILSEAVAGNSDVRERFSREARAISKLTHPNICTLFDVGTDHGHFYLVMECLTGETLAARLRAKGKTGLPLSEALKIATEIADALAFAHRHHIVHRDIKPTNIMLTPTGAKCGVPGRGRIRTGSPKRTVCRSVRRHGQSGLRRQPGRHALRDGETQ